MDFVKYQKAALQSVAITDKSIAALAHRSLGLVGEAGVIGNAMKMVIRDNNGQLSTKDVELLKEKIGDVLYYAAVLADFADLNLQDIARANIKKSHTFKQNRNTKLPDA
jgi:NTP pyrophosphatase (non-canonical NTP hydrolase)